MGLMLLTLSVAISLSACNKKDTETTDATEAIVESTEDPFSLGNVDIKVSTDIQQPQASTEVEVQETYEDGSYTGLLDNGDTIITMNGTDLQQYSKLSEGERVTIDVIISSWKTDSTLPEEYLTREINSNSFPSLSDKERTELIKEIKTEIVHDPSNTRELETQEAEQKPVLETKDYSNLSREDKEKLLEEAGLGSSANIATIDIEAIRDLPLGGAQ